jgi:hypothetical protein
MVAKVRKHRMKRDRRHFPPTTRSCFVSTRVT